MKRTLLLIGCLSAATLSTLLPSSSALADFIVVDNGPGSKIYSYSTTASSPAPATVYSNSPGVAVYAMAFDPADHLYIADWGSDELFTYSSSGVQKGFAAVSSPIGLAIDAYGNVYTGSDNGAEIQEFDVSGSPVRTIATGLQVDSLAFDATGNLYEADDSGVINEYLSDGKSMTYAQNLPASSYYGMAFDGDGNLFVTYQGADGHSGGVEEVAADGTMTTFATFGFVPTGIVYDSQSNKLFMTEVNDLDTGYGAVYELSTTDSSPGNPSFDQVFANNLTDPSGIAEFSPPSGGSGGASSTPEPGSFGLLLTGLSGFFLAYKKRAGKI